jgi:hypothetical protein
LARKKCRWLKKAVPRLRVLGVKESNPGLVKSEGEGMGDDLE